MDASKHVSTHAEDAAYKLLEEKGCVVIKGKSGSGKTHMSYTLLQRASKEFSREPVKISSPDEWNYLPLSGDGSSSTSKAAADQYIVMIDNIFGSTNLIQHNLDQWRQKFDLVRPQVESGQIWLVITTRPEIITQREVSLGKYEIFKSSSRIILDEEEHCLTEKEKLEFVTKLCGNCIAYEKRTSIAGTDTALGFPQCCKYFASHKHVQERGLDFFVKPFEFIKQEIDCVKEEQPDSYCVLLVVLAYDGCLPERLVKTISPEEEFTSRCKQMMKISGLKQEPNMKEILKSLCGVYLVSDGNCYQFSHRSIHDVLFVDLCESYPDLGIDMSTPSMLVEYIRTIGLKCDMLNVVVLDKEYFPKLANKLTEYLLNEDSRNIVLAHPSLNDGNIVELLKGCHIRRISLQRGKNVFQCGRMYDRRADILCLLFDDYNRDFKGFADFTYSYFLSHAIMKGMAILAKYIIHQVFTATDTGTNSMLDEALLCAVYMGQNRVVDILLSKGAQPSQICLDIFSGSPEMNFGIFSKLVEKVQPERHCLKLPIFCAAQCGNVTFLKYTIEMFPENMKDIYSEAIKRLIIKLKKSAMFVDISSKLSQAVDVMSLLHKAGGIIDLDEIVTLSFHKYAPDALIGLIHRLFQIPSSCHNDMQSSLCHNKSYHQLLKSLTDKVAPVQIKNKTVKTLLHEAARYQCKQCINILLSDDVEVTDEDGNTALHCMVISRENHNHEVLELLMDKTNYRHIKNKSGELPLHIAARRQCRECISRLLREVDVSKDHAGNPVHCTCDEGASSHRDELCEHVCQKPPDGKGSDVIMKMNKRQTKTPCKECGELLQPMSDINYQDEAGNTALHYLHDNKSYLLPKVELVCQETCQLFLANGADLHIKNKKGKTALHLATKAKCKNCVKMLVPMSDINDQDEVGNTALHYLQSNSHRQRMNECLDHETYQLFLDNGANVHIKNKKGKTALHLAAKAKCKRCVKMLLPMSDINDQDEVGNTALHYLQSNSHHQRMNECLDHETYQLFLDNGANVHIKNKKGKTALHLAAKAKCKRCVKMLLPMSDINDQDKVGNTALHNLHHDQSYCLTKAGHVCQETCQVFLDNGADVHIKNEKKQTVLHLAAEANCERCMKMLLPFSNVNDQDEVGKTALHYFTHNESYDEESDFDESDLDESYADESVFEGMNECLDHETYQLFLDKGANVHIKNKKGLTVLHLAAKAKCKRCVKMLLPMSDVNDQDEEGNTALHYLHRQKSYFYGRKFVCYETSELFLDTGADVHIKNKEGQSVLHLAAKANCKSCVEMLLPVSDVNEQDEAGNTALHCLQHNTSNWREYGCFCHEICQLLLEMRADVYTKNKRGQTILHLAVKANCNSCVKMLLPVSDIDAQDEEGNSALHYVQCYSNLHRTNECFCLETYQGVFDKQTYVHIKNKRGQTILHMAAKTNCNKWIEMLLPMFDINCQDQVGNTALHYLQHYSYFGKEDDCVCNKICQISLDNGADVHIKNEKEQTVLNLAAKANCERCMKMLLPFSNVNDQDEVGKTALHYLTHNESYLEESVLGESYFDESYAVQSFYERLNDCLDHEIYQLFLDNRADMHIKDRKGLTVLHLAAIANCNRCMKMFLPMSDVNDQDEEGNTALHYFIYRESKFITGNKYLDKETYQLLLDKGADVHIKNKRGQTMLHMAAKTKCNEWIEMLLPVFDINCQDQVGNTALHCLQHNSYLWKKDDCVCNKICQIFLDSGADVHIKNKKEQTVLHLAAEANCESCMESLLPFSNINDQDEVGKTALHYLTHNESYVDESDLDESYAVQLFYERLNECLDHEIYQLFLDKGADVRIKNKEGQTVLYLATGANCKSCVEMLLPMSDVNEQDEAGNTALHCLQHNTSNWREYECFCHEICQLLLEMRADVYTKNKRGQTILHLAAKANCNSCVKMLLPVSDIDAQDEEGNSALHYVQ